jgi:hypothetical protein
MGRAFGVKDALASWAFGVAFIASGGLLTLLSPRTLIGVSGATVVLVSVACAVALRRERLPAPSPAAPDSLGRGGRALGDLGGGEQGSDVVGGRDRGSPLLDHGD